MKRRITKRIVAIGFAILCILSTTTTSFAEYNEKAENQSISITNEPISTGFIDEQLEKALNNYKNNSYIGNSNKESSLDSKTPTVTFVPIDDDFIKEQNERFLKSKTLNIKYSDTETTRGTNPPTTVWNFVASGDYETSGNTQYMTLYSSYRFMCNSNHQLHISGSYLVAETQTSYLDIELVNASDGTTTHVYLQPHQLDPIYYDPFDTAYYFNFYIGPLNDNHQYYLKFNTFGSPGNHIGQHLELTVSHS